MQIDRLVRQETVSNISLGENNGLADDIVVHNDAVVVFIVFLDARDHLDGLRDRRLAYLDGLETSFKRGILLDILSVLVKGRRADNLHLAA